MTRNSIFYSHLNFSGKKIGKKKLFLEQKYNLTASTVGIRPFWQNIKDATEITYAAYDLQIPQVAIDLISNTTFADLTGCGAQCSFAQSVSAPSACFPFLVYAGKRSGADECLDPSFAPKPTYFNEATCQVHWNKTTGWTLVPPTKVDTSSPPCSADFLAYQKALGDAVAAGGLIRDGVGNLAESGALGQALANPATGYSVVYHIEIALLFATLVAIGPLVRVKSSTRLASQTAQVPQFGFAEISRSRS